MAQIPAHHRPVDLSITIRNGRYVIPVRREGRGAVGGIVHDASASGGTLFVEPPAAIEFGNRMRELEAAEVEEIERILTELTERRAPAARAHGRFARRAGPNSTRCSRAPGSPMNSTAPAPRSAHRTKGSTSPVAGIRCSWPRAFPSSRSTSRWSPPSARCWCRAPIPAARPCCSKRWGSSRRSRSRASPRRWAPAVAHSRGGRLLRRRRRRAVHRGQSLHLQRAPQEPRRDHPSRPRPTRSS